MTDSSCTWVLTLATIGFQLKHKYRHALGAKPYYCVGWHHRNFVAATRQVFLSDQETANRLEAAIGNICV
jgi:hypothetical protein